MRDIIVINQALHNIDSIKLEQFCNNAKSILQRDDYDFTSNIKELVLFIAFDNNGKNQVEVKTECKTTKDEEVSISLLISRLNHIINNNMIDSKFLGVNANFYLGLNYTKELQEYLNKIVANKKRAIKQQQEHAPSLSLRIENPRYSIEQIELSKKTKKAILETIALVQKQSLIYDDWGFKEVDGIAKTIINFHGKPGTGKTMSAHIIAHELGRQIIHSNYADIESKFVGDAPKNLVTAFDLAQKHNAILFFDEADSFLGKRISNIAQSADQALNSLRSELLKLLEERAVIVIFATNLLENYDKAFHSRILRSICFELPNKKQRKTIILKHIPPKLYEKGANKLSECELDTLSELADGFSGREIKNAVLNGLIAAAKDDILPDFRCFKKAFKAYKQEFDKVHGAENRNKSLGKNIKKNLKKGNFKTIRSKEYGNWNIARRNSVNTSDKNIGKR